MKNSNFRSITYATTINKNPNKHIKSVTKIANKIASEFNINFDNLNIEYNSSDSILILDIAFSADSEDAGNEFAECMTDSICEHFYDSPHIEVHETIHD